MKIIASNVSLQSTHVATTRQQTTETLRAWVGAPNGPSRQDRPGVEISAAGRARLEHDTRTRGTENADAATDAASTDPKLWLIKSIIEKLTGHRIRVLDASQLGNNASTDTDDIAAPAQAADAPPVSAGWGLEYDAHSVREEVEQTSFSAEGLIRTADGKEIRFQLDLSMNRSTREETTVSLRAGDAQRKDPLVLNFNGSAAQLLDTRFSFDLDSDGTHEQVAMLASGSGYLALDRNGNGSIDSGAELFGPATGSGMGELAGLDEDHNGWVDEGDSAFAQLRVWTPNADGNGSLQTLAERNVGALYASAVATPFSLLGTGNADLGRIATTSVYLTEAGEVGTTQEIDLTV